MERSIATTCRIHTCECRANPYTTVVDGTTNSGLWVGTSGQHGRYRWDHCVFCETIEIHRAINRQIAECILRKTYTDISQLTLDDGFVPVMRNNIVSRCLSFSSVDITNNNVSSVFKSTQAGYWISQPLAMVGVWQRLYVQLTSSITLTRVRITNVATSDALMYNGQRVRGASSVQILVKTTDPTGTDRTFVADIVYEGSLGDVTTPSRVRLKKMTPDTNDPHHDNNFPRRLYYI